MGKVEGTVTLDNALSSGTQMVARLGSLLEWKDFGPHGLWM
jgi:hypothetical protein